MDKKAVSPDSSTQITEKKKKSKKRKHKHRLFFSLNIKLIMIFYAVYIEISLVIMMTESTAGQPYLIIRVGHSMLYNTKVYIFHFVCSADHIWLKHIALSPSISYNMIWKEIMQCVSTKCDQHCRRLHIPASMQGMASARTSLF